MATARDYLATSLAALLTGYKVIPWDHNPDAISGPTVLFFRSRVEPAPEAPLGTWDNSITLYVATAKQVGAAAADALDVALDEVLVALGKIPDVTWSSATYTTLSETWPAFTVEASVLSNVAPTTE